MRETKHSQFSVSSRGVRYISIVNISRSFGNIDIGINRKNFKDIDIHKKILKNVDIDEEIFKNIDTDINIFVIRKI